MFRCIWSLHCRQSKVKCDPEWFWYRKKLVPEKVSEPVSEKNWYRKFCCQNFGILKIYNGYRYREFFIFSSGIVTGIGKFGTGKSLRTGIGQIWYRKKVPYRYRKCLVPEKKYLYWYRLTFWVPSHTALWVRLNVKWEIGKCIPHPSF